MRAAILDGRMAGTVPAIWFGMPGWLDRRGEWVQVQPPADAPSSNVLELPAGKNSTLELPGQVRPLFPKGTVLACSVYVRAKSPISTETLFDLGYSLFSTENAWPNLVSVSVKTLTSSWAVLNGRYVLPVDSLARVRIGPRVAVDADIQLSGLRMWGINQVPTY